MLARQANSPYLATVAAISVLRMTRRLCVPGARAKARCLGDSRRDGFERPGETPGPALGALRSPRHLSVTGAQSLRSALFGRKKT